jgi:hypothetical protein
MIKYERIDEMLLRVVPFLVRTGVAPLSGIRVEVQPPTLTWRDLFMRCYIIRRECNDLL